MRTVVIESPFAGETERNLKYVRECMVDCLDRGEAPFASHALYTQPGVLDDMNSEDRRKGIEAGLAIARQLDATVVYADLGITRGMVEGMERAVSDRRPIEVRTLRDAVEKGA